MSVHERLTRREFVRTCLGVGVWAVACRSRAAESASRPMPPVALFDKVCVQAGLSLEETADLVASSGADGVDCAVRPRDRIEPERVREDLPRYAELLRARGKRVWLLTTAILSPESPHAREVLETARGLGVKYYRVGFLRKDPDQPTESQLRWVRERLRALAAWNRELGMCALLQNHSPAGSSQYLGGDLREMLALVEGFPPDTVAVAFDPGHALLVHGDEWRDHFERLRSHVGVVYVKDTDRKRRFVPFGEGEFGRMRLFPRLREQGYAAPFSLHIEFDWVGSGQRTRERLEQAVRESLQVLRRWWETG
ncbi:sugar phosphate isomerase/epimerase family protein [Limisphaera sp. VF-2]|uniref:sugar phosphate isomerase/epimerase family protein n=1 Tax=Limisphaera sp. VF-2 TaxID=3400418 RepID=UPI00256A760D|nr:sugar phosphate isomerase/epimerase [Limisphaera sp.]